MPRPVRAGVVGAVTNDSPTTRSVRARLVVDGAHYTDLVTRIRRATLSVWIATANLKDLIPRLGR